MDESVTVLIVSSEYASKIAKQLGLKIVREGEKLRSVNNVYENIEENISDAVEKVKNREVDMIRFSNVQTDGEGWAMTNKNRYKQKASK